MPSSSLENPCQNCCENQRAGNPVLSQSWMLGQDPQIGWQEFNGLQMPTLLKKQLCDRAQNRGLLPLWFPKTLNTGTSLTSPASAVNLNATVSPRTFRVKHQWKSCQ